MTWEMDNLSMCSIQDFYLIVAHDTQDKPDILCFALLSETKYLENYMMNSKIKLVFTKKSHLVLVFFLKNHVNVKAE